VVTVFLSGRFRASAQWIEFSRTPFTSPCPSLRFLDPMNLFNMLEGDDLKEENKVLIYEIFCLFYPFFFFFFFFLYFFKWLKFFLTDIPYPLC
jgi:hypothetical protein